MQGLKGWLAVEAWAPEVVFGMELEAELCFHELSLELAYQDACAAYVRGETSDVPDPAAYLLSEEQACKIAAQAYRDEVEATARMVEDCDPAADTVREPFRRAG